jgi:hypothetical protein
VQVFKRKGSIKRSTAPPHQQGYVRSELRLAPNSGLRDEPGVTRSMLAANDTAKRREMDADCPR